MLDLAYSADLRPRRPRVRARRGRVALSRPRRALSRFHLRRRRQRARPCASEARRGDGRAGAQALARLQPVPHSRRERLADRLCAACFADFVFFCNSGAEAIEGAIKMARKYHAVNGQPERYRIVTFEGAFHGRTLADARGGRKQEISRRLRPAGRRLRSGAVRRSRGGEEGDRAGDRRRS